MKKKQIWQRGRWQWDDVGATFRPLSLRRRHRVYSANGVSQHHCLKTDLMSGLKRISRVLMNMVGWTIYRALMFFLYLEKKKRRGGRGSL